MIRRVRNVNQMPFDMRQQTQQSPVRRDNLQVIPAQGGKNHHRVGQAGVIAHHQQRLPLRDMFQPHGGHRTGHLIQQPIAGRAQTLLADCRVITHHRMTQILHQPRQSLARQPAHHRTRRLQLKRPQHLLHIESAQGAQGHQRIIRCREFNRHTSGIH